MTDRILSTDTIERLELAGLTAEEIETAKDLAASVKFAWSNREKAFSVHFRWENGRESSGTTENIVRKSKLHRTNRFKSRSRPIADKTFELLIDLGVALDWKSEKFAWFDPSFLLESGNAPEQIISAQMVRYQLSLSKYPPLWLNCVEVVEVDSEKRTKSLEPWLKFVANCRVGRDNKSSMHEFFEDQLITDDLMIKRALSEGWPVAPYDEECADVYCPRCSTKWRKIEDGKEHWRYLLDCGFTFNMQFFRRKAGQIFSDPLLVNFLKQHPAELPIVKVTEGLDFFLCRQCNNEFLPSANKRKILEKLQQP